MTELAPAQQAPSTEELIQQCGQKILDVMRMEMDDSSDPDRVWILRKIHKNYLYYRGLQLFAPQFAQNILDATSVSAQGISDESEAGIYDYLQNHYRGYCRKLEAVLGNRMPNAIAMPDNADDPDAEKATRSANTAAEYIREKCDLQMKNLMLVFGLFNFGTMFWHIDWNVDGDKYGVKTTPIKEAQPQPMGNAMFECPKCAQGIPADLANPQPPAQCPNCGSPIGPENYRPPQTANAPVTKGVQRTPQGGLELTLHNAVEVMVPLDAIAIGDNCPWLRREWDRHKAILLQRYDKEGPPGEDGQPTTTNPLRDTAFMDSAGGTEQTAASQYAESIRSAMGSPVGLVRGKPSNRWTEADTWWEPSMYQMIDDKQIRETLKTNFPTGLRITEIRGKIVDLKEEKLTDRWQDCPPEPSVRIMADPLGDDWVETQDILANTLNQMNETIERSNEPGYGDPRYIDFDAYERRRDNPTMLIPAVKPAGGSLADILWRPEPNKHSEQIVPFRQMVEETSKNNSGITDPIFGGGDAEEPTARQAELKKNAALMQLGVPWTFMGKSLEKVYEKSCRLLAEYEDGVLAFSKKNQFGRYDTMSVIVNDLRNGKYHFEADEAIPMTWGQMRDLLMWMLDKPAPLLEAWGMNHPMNIFENKKLLGMPGEYTPFLDLREKCMDTIALLLKDKPQQGPPGPPDQTGQPTPGQMQSSIQPAWEDDPQFCMTMAKAFLQANSTLATDNPDGYQNVLLWGKAFESILNQPQPKPPVKASVAVALKGADLGNPAVQAALTGSGVIPDGTPVEAVIPPPKGMMPPPGAQPQPNGQPAPPLQ